MEITERTNTIIGIVIGVILVGSLITILYMDFNDLGYWSKETPSMTCNVPESERPTPCKPDERNITKVEGLLV